MRNSRVQALFPTDIFHNHTMSYALRDRFASYLSPHQPNHFASSPHEDFLSLSSPKKFDRWETEYSNQFIYPVAKPEIINELFEQPPASTVEQISHSPPPPEAIPQSPQPSPVYSEPYSSRPPPSLQSPAPTAHGADQLVLRRKPSLYDNTISTGPVFEKQTAASVIRMKRTLSERAERHKREEQEKVIQESLWRKNSGSKSNPSSPSRKKVTFSPQVVLPIQRHSKLFQTQSTNSSASNSPMVVRHTPTSTPVQQHPPSTPSYDESPQTARNIPSQISQNPPSRDTALSTSSGVPRRLDAETLTRVLATSVHGFRVSENFNPQPSPVNNPKYYKYVPPSFMSAITPAGRVEPRSPLFEFDEYD